MERKVACAASFTHRYLPVPVYQGLSNTCCHSAYTCPCFNRQFCASILTGTRHGPAGYCFEPALLMRPADFIQERGSRSAKHEGGLLSLGSGITVPCHVLPIYNMFSSAKHSSTVCRCRHRPRIHVQSYDVQTVPKRCPNDAQRSANDHQRRIWANRRRTEAQGHPRDEL